MNLYADTSALVKHYHDEIGSDQVDDWMRSAKQFFSSALTRLEMTAFVERSKINRRFDSPTYRTIVSEIERDIATKKITLLDIDHHVVAGANQLIKTRRLRVQDALQLASALALQQRLAAPLAFLCADQHLLSAARLEGLRCLNPL